MASSTFRITNDREVFRKGISLSELELQTRAIRNLVSPITLVLTKRASEQHNKTKLLPKRQQRLTYPSNATGVCLPNKSIGFVLLCF